MCSDLLLRTAMDEAVKRGQSRIISIRKTFARLLKIDNRWEEQYEAARRLKKLNKIKNDR